MNETEGEILGWDQINHCWLVALIKREWIDVWNKKVGNYVKKNQIRRLTVSEALNELWKIDPDDVLYRYTRDEHEENALMLDPRQGYSNELVTRYGLVLPPPDTKGKEKKSLRHQVRSLETRLAVIGLQEHQMSYPIDVTVPEFTEVDHYVLKRPQDEENMIDKWLEGKSGRLWYVKDADNLMEQQEQYMQNQRNAQTHPGQTESGQVIRDLYAFEGEEEVELEVGKRVALKLKPGHVWDGLEGVVIGQTWDTYVMDDERREKKLLKEGKIDIEDTRWFRAATHHDMDDDDW